MGAGAPLGAQPANASFQSGSELSRRVAGARGAILQADGSLAAKAGEPLAYGPIADAKGGGGLGSGPVLTQDALDQAQPAGEAKPGIGVALHRGLTREGNRTAAAPSSLDPKSLSRYP